MTLIVHQAGDNTAGTDINERPMTFSFTATNPGSQTKHWNIEVDSSSQFHIKFNVTGSYSVANGIVRSYGAIFRRGIIP